MSTINPDLALIEARLEAAGKVAAEGDAYYNGTQAEAYILAAMRDRPNAERARESGAFRLRFPAAVVDAAVDGCGLAGWQGPDETAAIWEDNQLDFELPEAMRACFKHGEAFLLTLPMPDGDGDPIPGTARVTWHPSTDVAVLYDEERPTMQRVAGRRWNLPAAGGKRPRRMDLYYPDRVEQWKQDDRRQPWQPHPVAAVPDIDPVTGEQLPRLTSTDEALEPHHLEWEWGQAVHHLRTERPNGAPVHALAYGPQDIITKLVAGLVVSADFSAWPQRWERFDPTQPLPDTASFEDTDDDGTDDALLDDPEESTYAAGPGRVWRMIADAVGQFEPADLVKFTETADRALIYMSALTTVPLHRFQGYTAPPTGRALRQAERPHNRKVDTWRAALKHAIDAALTEAVGIARDGDPDEVSLQWRPLEIRDDSEAFEQAAAEIDLGVPPAVALGRLGLYTDEQLEAWFPDGVGSTNAAVDRVALVAQRLHLAVPTILSEAEARQILAGVAAGAGITIGP